MCLPIAVQTKFIIVGTMLWLMLSGCRPAEVTPTPILCNTYPLIATVQPDCIAYNTATLIQTALDQQAQLTVEQVELTIKGTTYIQPQDNQLTIIVLEGSTLIGVDNTITTLTQGQQVTWNPTLAIDAPSDYDPAQAIQLPLEQLQREIIITVPTATPQAIIPTPDSACVPPPDWIDQYHVQAGDTLTTIAQAVDVSLADLQAGNCINNPNNLQIGQILNIPQGALQPTQPAVTFTPSAVFFRADKETIPAGTCTTLRWDVQNIREILLDSSIVTSQTSQDICPTETTTYILTVGYFDDTQTQHQITITVESS